MRTDKRFYSWISRCALAIAVAGPVYASGQQVVEEKSDQKITQQVQDQVQNKDVVLVALATAAPAPTASSSAAPVYTPHAMAPSAYNWTGFYIGVHIGHGTGPSHTFFDPLPTAATFFNLLPQTLTTHPKGVLGGVQFGANYQQGHFLLGAEAEATWTGMSGSTTVTPIIQNDHTPFPGAGFLSTSEHTRWLGSIRPRVGFPLFQRLLVYGTGGVAFGETEDFAITNFRPAGTTIYQAAGASKKTGWVGGFGAEVGLTRRWSAKAEFLHYNLGRSRQTVQANPLLPPFQVAYTFGQTAVNNINVGVNFRF